MGQTASTGGRPAGAARETLRLFPVVLPVVFAGAAVACTAVWWYVRPAPSAAELAGLFAFLVAATFVEAFPVPIENVPVGGTSLASVFIVAAAVVYGWAAATIVAGLAQVLVELGRRRPFVRVAYNSAVYVLAGSAAGAATSLAGAKGFVGLTTDVLLGATAFYLVDLPLVAAVVARWAREGFGSLLARAVSSTFVAFAIMASLSLMLVVLWERSPFLSAALVGPLAAIALYQRSVHRELEAMRLALTDPLTGLGNRRSFFEQLERDVLNAEVGGPPVALCVLDIDDFKEINDERGHLAGDRVLVAVAARLRQNGEAFRLGGDEFALLLHRRPADAVATAKEVLTRLPVSASAGIVAYPQPGTERGELVQLADSALYRAKEQGKRGVHLHRPSPAPVGDLRRLADDRDRDARLSAAASLAHAVDARDAYIGAHSSVVSELAARIAAAMNLSADAVELTRLAGNLHDLGKLAVPEEILRKPGSLTDEERLVVERHPEIGFRMLESLGVEPVATWVRHHHERWDGGGYPDGLAGRAIPLGSRIVFVADAYDAMTSDRVYGARVSHETAVGELERCAGAQFDPDVVAAFLAGLTRAELAALKAS